MKPGYWKSLWLGFKALPKCSWRERGVFALAASLSLIGVPLIAALVGFYVSVLCILGYESFNIAMEDGWWVTLVGIAKNIAILTGILMGVALALGLMAWGAMYVEDNASKKGQP